MYSATRTLNAICNSAWAITEEALGIIVRVALRENEDIEAVEARLGRKLDNAHTVTMRDGVATIPVNGPLFRYANLFTMISGGTTIDTLAQDFTLALADPAIRAIVLHIDSPGGQINGINEFAQMIYAARGTKPITAYVGNLGASAAYWIAAAADAVVVDATALIGSIGVLAAYRGGTSEKEITFVSSQSPKKRPDPATEGGRSQIQSEIDSLADVFVANVAQFRETSVETVLHDFGQGGVLVGQQAVDAGMVDRLGSYEQVLAELVQRTTPSALRARSIGVRHMSGEHDPTQPSADTLALQAQLAEMRQLLANERTERIKTEASAYVAGQVRDSRILPAEEGYYASLYTQLAQDDLNTPLAQSSRLDLLRGAIGARPQHTKTVEQLPSGTVLEPHGTQATTEGVSEARKNELLAKTPEGRAVLSGKPRR